MRTGHSQTRTGCIDSCRNAHRRAGMLDTCLLQRAIRSRYRRCRGPDASRNPVRRYTSARHLRRSTIVRELLVRVFRLFDEPAGHRTTWGRSGQPGERRLYAWGLFSTGRSARCSDRWEGWNAPVTRRSSPWATRACQERGPVLRGPARSPGLVPSRTQTAARGRDRRVPTARQGVRA